MVKCCRQVLGRTVVERCCEEMFCRSVVEKWGREDCGEVL